MILIHGQIHVCIDINPLVEIAAGCLRFVTEFFEVIDLSRPHIYHSALLRTPPSSIIRKPYGKEICSPSIKGCDRGPCLVGFMHSEHWHCI